jgi:hypothetical protein
MKAFRSLKVLLLAFAGLFVGGLRERFATANAETATGTNTVYTRRADAALSYTHLLIKKGTDAFHVAVCGATDRPCGSTTDSPDDAEAIVHVNPLNRAESSRKLRCATALAADIDLYTAASGFVQGEPAVAGTYWRVGRSSALAVQEGSGNYIIDVVTHAPVKVVVIAALGNANGAIAALNSTAVNPTKADFDALLAATETLADDVRAIAAALATPAEVKVLT